MTKHSKRVKLVENPLDFRGKDEEKNVLEAKKILREELKGNTVLVERGFKQHGARGSGKVAAAEKAQMMKAIVEKPDMTGKEFASKFGYPVYGENKQFPSGAASRMLVNLRQEIEGVEIPEMEDILRADLVSVALGLKEQLRRLKEEPDTISFADIEAKIDRAFKRIRLLRGESTSSSEIRIGRIEGMKESELDAFLNDVITIESKD